MSIKQIESYLSWCQEYLEWCLDADGRVSSYDRMCNVIEKYSTELEKRKKAVAGKFSHGKQ